MNLKKYLFPFRGQNYFTEKTKRRNQNHAFFLHSLGQFYHTLLLSTYYALSHRAPVEDAGMWTAWPLPQSVFVPVGSEDANRLGSWEQRRGAVQQGGIGTPESG